MGERVGLYRETTQPRDIRVLALDVDGVLTSGAIFLDGERELKQFNVQDGLGLQLAQRGGIKVFFVTSRPGPVVEQRAKELGIDGLRMVTSGKGAALKELCAEAGSTLAQVAFVGDDVVDLPAMRICGLPIAVANAVDEVKAAAAYVTERKGGKGAVREVVEWLLKEACSWDEVLEGYLADQS
jgi:3-deoxy-D-manno-octulosonate 8-phosphate phosphatase (KDO 8-P phosphatase)